MSKKITRFRISISSIILLAWLITLSVSAEIYKWVDDEGNVHYGEKPPNTPTDRAVENIKIKDDVSTSDNQRANETFKEKSKSLDENRKKRKKEKEDVEIKKEELAKMKAHCEEAKKNLTNYQYPKVSFVEDDGTVRSLGEEERQEGMKEAEKIVGEVCN